MHAARGVELYELRCGNRECGSYWFIKYWLKNSHEDAILQGALCRRHKLQETEGIAQEL